MPVCIIMVGLPGVGKSTWISKNQPNMTVISSDDIIQDMCDQFNLTYNEGFSGFIKPADRLFWDKIRAAVGLKMDFIVDRTNLSVSSRKRIINHLTDDYRIKAEVFSTPEEGEWRRRLNSRPDKTIPEHVLSSMAKNYVAPDFSEGFNSIFHNGVV